MFLRLRFCAMLNIPSKNITMLQEEISQKLTPSLCDSPATFDVFSKRLTEGHFTRDENIQSHFCVFFFPYNATTKEVFIVHHKKSGFWIAPGGHIDKGEGILQSLNREIQEELGVPDAYKETPSPFLFTTCAIDNTVQPCKMHYDIWYLLETDGSDFAIDPTEFLDTQWVSIADARKRVTVPENVAALNIIETREK